MIGCDPIECGTKVLNTDEKVALTLDEWEAPMVDEIDIPSKLEVVPSIVKTMARIDETIGVAPIERFRLLVLGGGVTPMVDEVIFPMVSGLRLLSVKETVEATVEEVDSSLSVGGVASPNIGLSRSK